MDAWDTEEERSAEQHCSLQPAMVKVAMVGMRCSHNSWLLPDEYVINLAVCLAPDTTPNSTLSDMGAAACVHILHL